MPDKPVDKRLRTSPEARLGNEAGRLVPDDRGNITWEWRDDGDVDADGGGDEARRVQGLLVPSLELVKDPDEIEDPGKPSTTRVKVGYNPYDSGPLGKQEWKKKKDLRELGRWIEMRRKLTGKASGQAD